MHDGVTLGHVGLCAHLFAHAESGVSTVYTAGVHTLLSGHLQRALLHCVSYTMDTRLAVKADAPPAPATAAVTQAQVAVQQAAFRAILYVSPCPSPLPEGNTTCITAVITATITTTTSISSVVITTAIITSTSHCHLHHHCHHQHPPNSTATISRSALHHHQ